MSRFGQSSSYSRVASQKTNPPKTHNFLFTVINPPGVNGDAPQEELVRFSTDSVEISAFDVQTEEFSTSSVTIPYATGIDFSAITVGFTEQTNHRVIEFLTAWRDLMFNVGRDATGVAKDTVNPLNTYVRNAEMDLAEPNKDDPITEQYELRNIFPSSVEPVNYDYSDDGSKVDYQVEFAVHRIDTNNNPA